MSEYVDRDELRRKLEAAIESKVRASDSSWGQGWLTGVRDAINRLAGMPPLVVPRGWSRDEVLAAIDAGSTIHGAEVKRIMVARAVLAVPAIADALAGCHAVTSDEGTSYCPLAEANAAAVARDAKVAEIVAESCVDDEAYDDVPVSYRFADCFDDVAALYPETGK